MQEENARLRILVVLPMYGGSLPIGRFCASALEEMAHVRIFAADALYSGFQGLKKLDLTSEQLNPLEHAYLQLVSQALLAHVQAFDPHLVLALAQAPLSKQVLLRLKRQGIRTCMWFVEDYRLFTYWKTYAPLYDCFAVIQKEPFLSNLSAIGQPNAIYLPLAAHPAIHHKQSLTLQEQKEYGSKISFLGAGYPNRRLAFRTLAGKDFKIWGSDWEGEELLKGNIQREGKRISTEESLKIYSASTINLNLHSSVETKSLVGHGDFVNPRTFELAALEAFQLVDERTLLPELFNKDELAVFSSVDEMYRMIEFYLHNPAKREEKVAKAHQRVVNEHTYQKRMETLLNYLWEHVGFPKREAEQKDANSPLQAEIASLFDELHIPPKSDFSEVVDRLRRKTGALSPLETSLLFLDEWQKQYAPKKIPTQSKK